ncbi:hypothetical protein NDU88_006127 [Pleurodeles waltl]|uniref:Uncharacterized protein n=1 Tax=Pleurodeles waltl TaxID=8319 RepID=A0AAV7SNR4_PLEWA|nr:hypothetical protein NDU88_006127 [Pleurodeles waltl]
MPRPTACTECGEARHPTLGLGPHRGQQREPRLEKGAMASPAAGQTDHGSNHSLNQFHCRARGGPRNDR